MTWTDDPELQAMFMSELEERSARLVEGGEAMIAGAVDAEISSTMLREGHTIKGTGRVMGYDAISVAGQQLEMLWRRIQSEEIEPHPELGAAIAALATVLPAAGTADPKAGTPELTDAMAAVDAALGTGSPAAKPKLRAVEPVEPEAQLEESEEPTEQDVAPAVIEPEAVEPEVKRPRIKANTSDVGGISLRERLDNAAAEDAAAEDAAATEQDITPSSPVVREPEDPPVPDVVDDTVEETSNEVASEEEFSHEYVRPRRPKAPEPTPSRDAPARPIEPPAAASITADLGGLLGAVESWASVETLPVSAGRMYRLINLVARIRIDVEAADRKIREVRNSDDLDALEASVSAILSAAGDLEHDAMQLAAVPLSSMTNTLPQLVRFVAKKLDKEVRFEIVGDTEVVVDRQVLDKIADPLRQLVVNGITHGIENPEVRQRAGKPTTGSIALSVTVKDRRLELVVSDDGAGVDWAAVRNTAIENNLLTSGEAADEAKLNDVLFNPGFSTGGMSDLSGSGKGLSSVSEIAESLFGRVRLESTSGNGSAVALTVPTSRALQRVMILDSAGMQWGLPESVVEEVLPIDEADIDWTGNVPTLSWRGEKLPVSPLGELVGAAESRLPKTILIISHRIGSAAVTVHGVQGVREVAAKELGPLLAGPSHITGAALLGGGEVVLVLDASALVTRTHSAPPDDERGDRVLVVDDSIGARAVVSGALASSGFVTSVASSAAEALEILDGQVVEALVVDFSMPQEDGAQLVAKVRDRGITVPIVMLSGVATEDDKARSKEAGVDVFFDKADFREGALAETLRDLLRSE
ncbi:MAG: response regulator [bacterium]|nr:response regulator [bacterium]